MDLRRGTKIKPLPTSHTLVPQLMREKLWPPEPLTQSSLTGTHRAQTSTSSFPRGRWQPREAWYLLEAAHGLRAVAEPCSNHSGLQVAAGEASLDTPLQRRAARACLNCSQNSG